MKTTALPNDITVEEIFYSRGNDKLRVQFHDGKFSIETANWEFKDIDDLNALLDVFRVEVKPVVKPKAEPKPKPQVLTHRTTTKQRRTWTDEQKKDIAERYKNGEGPASIAKDYDCTANSINLLTMRMGLERKRTYLTKKRLTPEEQEKKKKEQKAALKKFRDSQDLPWYLKDDNKRKSKD